MKLYRKQLYGLECCCFTVSEYVHSSRRTCHLGRSMAVNESNSRTRNLHRSSSGLEPQRIPKIPSSYLPFKGRHRCANIDQVDVRSHASSRPLPVACRQSLDNCKKIYLLRLFNDILDICHDPSFCSLHIVFCLLDWCDWYNLVVCSLRMAACISLPYLINFL